MANVVVTAWKGVWLGDAAVSSFTNPNMESALIKLTLIDTATDTFNPSTDQDIADLAAGARVATGTLAAKTVVMSGANATFDADNLTMPTVTGDSVENALIWYDSTVEATSLALIHFDTFTSGMPLTPNGGDIVNTFHASGIAQF